MINIADFENDVIRLADLCIDGMSHRPMYPETRDLLYMASDCAEGICKVIVELRKLSPLTVNDPSD